MEKQLFKLSKLCDFMRDDEDFMCKILKSIGYDTDSMSDDDNYKVIQDLSGCIFHLIDCEETGNQAHDLDIATLTDVRDFSMELTSSESLAKSVMNVLGLDSDEEESHSEIYEISKLLENMVKKNNEGVSK